MTALWNQVQIIQPGFPSRDDRYDILNNVIGSRSVGTDLQTQPVGFLALSSPLRVSYKEMVDQTPYDKNHGGDLMHNASRGQLQGIISNGLSR